MREFNIYDFDKTIYNGDSTLNFYFFCLRKKISLIFLFPIQFLYFLLYKLRIIKKARFKEKFFIFLKYIKDIDYLVELFWKENFKNIKEWFITDKSVNKIIISASPEFLLLPLINKLNVIDIIATKVDKFNGKFISKNCYGEEKVRRLNCKYKDYYINNFYSDSQSDIYIAKISKNSYLVKGNHIVKWL